MQTCAGFVYTLCQHTLLTIYINTDTLETLSHAKPYMDNRHDVCHLLFTLLDS